LTWRLLARGARVTLFNRGHLADPFGDRVERIRGDRTTGDLARALAGRTGEFDAIVDFAAYKAEDVEGVIALFSGNPRLHYVFISTGQVYLVRAGVKLPAGEDQYDGPVIPKPTNERELGEWTYGVEKRSCEDLLFAARAKTGFRFTTFRIPMVNGARDYFRRMEGYFYRMLDGGPLILPGGGAHPVRHVYAPDVAAMIARVLGDEDVIGQAYNLAQDEMPSLNELLQMIAAHLGAPLDTIDVPREEVIKAGFEPVFISPFSGLWMSRLDPSRAKSELRFVHCPLDQYLRSIVESFVAHFPGEPPPGYSTRRAELELAKRFRS
jgi:nucleoside-diphosphate-sugar epimerase